MTTIKASCPTCGDCDLTPAQVRCTDGPRGWYSFACPACRDTIYKQAPPNIQALLRGGGVRIEHVPAEVWEPREGARLTHDDLLEFHERLKVSDMVADVVERESA